MKPSTSDRRAKGWDLRLMEFEPFTVHSEMCMEYQARQQNAQLDARLTEVIHGRRAAKRKQDYADELLKMQLALDVGCTYRWRVNIN